jgi:hypothetical protein
MSVYNPSTPNSTDLISATQAPIKTNFTQLNTQFGVDHTPFNNGGVNGDGHHTQVTLNAPVSVSPTGTQAIYHSVNGANFFNGVPIAYFANSMGDYQLLPDLKSSGTQHAFKIGNIIINYGTISLPPNSLSTVTLLTGFTYTSTSSYIVQATAAPSVPVTAAAPIVVNVNASQFNISNRTAGATIIYNFFTIGT